MDEPRIETVGRAHPKMAEVAEVLGCPTDLVYAIVDKPAWGGISVLYTPGYPESKDTYAAFLVRGEDGVLHHAKEPKNMGPILDQLLGY